MKNKTIIYVAVAIIIGLILGKNIYDGYAKEVDDVFNEKKCAENYLDAENNGVHIIPRIMANRYIFRFYPFTWLLNLLKAVYYKITRQRI